MINKKQKSEADNSRRTIGVDSGGLLGVMYREITFLERICSDGSRTIECIRQECRSASGQPIPSADGVALARTYLRQPESLPLWGYPCEATLRSIFEDWPEVGGKDEWKPNCCHFLHPKKN